MKEFNLERALAGEPVVTRDGHQITQIHYESKVICGLPVTAFIEEIGWRSFKESGKYYDRGDSSLDLFMAPVKKECWTNIYLDSKCGLKYIKDDIYNTKEVAEEEGKKLNDYVATARVEWEE